MIIESDLMDICSAIRMIDENYILVFNEQKNKYEVHNMRDDPSYCMTVPFEELDFRTVKLLFDSHISRRQAYFDALERENEELEKLKDKKDKEELRAEVERLF